MLPSLHSKYYNHMEKVRDMLISYMLPFMEISDSLNQKYPEGEEQEDTEDERPIQEIPVNDFTDIKEMCDIAEWYLGEEEGEPIGCPSSLHIVYSYLVFNILFIPFEAAQEKETNFLDRTL